MKKTVLIVLLALIAAATASAQFLPQAQWSSLRFHGEWMSERGRTVREPTGAVQFDWSGDRYIEVRETVWVSAERRVCGYIWQQGVFGWAHEWRCDYRVWWRYYWRYDWVRG